jgi:hypothetical protein
VELAKVDELVGVPAEFFLEFAIGGHLQRLIRLDHPTGEHERLAVQGRRPLDRDQHVAVLINGHDQHAVTGGVGRAPSGSFFADVLGFDAVLAQADYGIVTLYEHCQACQVVHPDGGLREQPWGTREFTILDPDRNAVTFFEDS